MKFLFCTFIIIIVMACDKAERECLQTDIYRLPPSIEEIYDCPDTRYSLEINQKESYMRLSKKKDYDEKVNGSCHPDIDFEKYDLLIGKKQLQSGNHSIHYELQEDCSRREILVVRFYQNMVMESPNITYHVLLPKSVENNEIVIETMLVYDWDK